QPATVAVDDVDTGTRERTAIAGEEDPRDCDETQGPGEERQPLHVARVREGCLGVPRAVQDRDAALRAAPEQAEQELGHASRIGTRSTDLNLGRGKPAVSPMSSLH